MYVGRNIKDDEGGGQQQQEPILQIKGRKAATTIPAGQPQLTIEQLNQLLATIGCQTTGSFSRCTARYTGGEGVLAFLNAIQIYKDCEHISEQKAVMGLPMLLEKKATTSRPESKDTITTWDEAMTALQKAFGSTKAPDQLLREIFATEQSDTTPSKRFICEKRALLAEFPEDCRMPEPVQIDTIYSLLHRRVKKKLAKTQFDSYDTLTAELLNSKKHYLLLRPNPAEQEH
ncbi:hypothetical protein FQA39_LY00408 [Lamprigera yunnana]|nr:hypothetical protein FQA39_LY00408 [Lamprigera yunnana]